MSERRGDNGAPLEDLLDQLRHIAENVQARAPAAEADAVRDDLDVELAVRFPDYLSFLADAGCIDWDRRAGRLEPGNHIDLALDAPPSWSEDVSVHFDDAIAEEPGTAGREGDESSEESAEFGSGSEDDAPQEAFEIAESSEIVDLDEPVTGDGGSGEDEASPEVISGGRTGETSESSDSSLAKTATGDDPVEQEELGSRAETPNRNDSSSSRVETNHSPDSEGAGGGRGDTTSNQRTQSKRRKQDRRNESEEMARPSSNRDRYERIEEIGTGGLGTVYKARHKPLDRDVAIKEISKIFDVFADLQRDEIVERFREITRAQAQISHPSVAQIFDLHTDGEYPFSVTEFAPNGSLRRLIDDEERRTLRVVLKYFIQLLHGLNAAHREDLVHGNIKPENVLLDASGNAKLSDFGLATLVDLEDASEQVYVGVGAVAYMAPEQFQNPNSATKRSDVYALGILFYEMLTGKVPGRRSPMPSSFFPEIPRSLDDIFDQMTMDTQENRFESIEEILRAFYSADEIVELLDRQSGVVFLRDPIEYGDEPVTGEGSRGGDADAGDSSDEPAETVRTDAAPVDEIDEHEGTPRAANGSESSEDVEESDAGAGDEEDAAASEETETPDDPDTDRDGDEEPPAREEAEDGEVLEKIDEYGEMFEEEE